jgi:putative DNA primase/helicase
MPSSCDYPDPDLPPAEPSYVDVGAQDSGPDVGSVVHGGQARIAYDGCLMSVTSGTTAEQAAGLMHARHLIDHGVPVFIAKPDVTSGIWNPTGGHNGTGYWFPREWQKSTADLAVIENWAPGAALCAVTGVVVDVLDVDPRAGGHQSQSGLMAAGMWPMSYGTASTPSGGTHDCVRLLGTPSRDALCPGLDVKAGAPNGKGRGFAFIAPTKKLSKTTGEVVAYEWIVAPNLDDIDASDDSGSEIAEMIRNACRAPAEAGTSVPRFALPPIIRHHNRDDTFFRYACALRARGTTVSDSTAIMTEAWKTCEQPEDEFYPLASALAKIDQAWANYDGPGAERVALRRVVDSDGHDDHGVHRGQLRMALRLAENYNRRLMFVHALGWYFWTGTRWAQDDQGVAHRAVHEVLSTALHEGLDRKDEELRSDVRRCETAPAIAGILAIASTREDFAYTVQSLDADPYLLNVANGTLDVRTRAVHTPDPADRITKIAPAAYRPEVDGTSWTPFLNSVLPDAEVRAFLQRLAGVGLLGTVREHVLPILTGTGANGKGTLYKALLGALGDYAGSAEPDLFMHRDGAHPTGEMDLRGLRLVVVSESDKDRQLAEATMKRLTGGDPIKARHMRQDFVEFEPSHLPMLITNHLPKVSGDDPATWRRIRVIPFEVTFSDAEQDRGLDDALRLDADAVLTWMVDGYRLYEEHGLAAPDAVLRATSAYQLDSDALGRFIKDRCGTGPQCQCAVSRLYQAWESWCSEDGTDPGSKKALGVALERRGFPEHRTGQGRFRKGICLRPADEDSDDEGQ